MPQPEIVINASGVSPDILIWLKKSNIDGHFYIERRPNKYETNSDYFPITEKDAIKLQAMTTENAWRAMERMVGVTPC